jgi:hypothetical protein
VRSMRLSSLQPVTPVGGESSTSFSVTRENEPTRDSGPEADRDRVLLVRGEVTTGSLVSGATSWFADAAAAERRYVARTDVMVHIGDRIECQRVSKG